MDSHSKPHSVKPLFLSDPKSVLPRRYVMHRHSQRCKACGTESSHCELYQMNELPTSMGRMVTNLIPVKQIDYNLPIQCEVIPTREVPVCHSCVTTTSFAHLPDPTNTEEWKRQYQPAPHKYGLGRAAEGSRPSSKDKPAPTIDDLLNI